MLPIFNFEASFGVSVLSIPLKESTLNLIALRMAKTPRVLADPSAVGLEARMISSGAKSYILRVDTH